MAIITEEIQALSREIREENGRREELLRHKCNWEQMSRCAVLREYGDPATWPAFKELRKENGYKCPQCESETGIKFPSGLDPYCEDCGWPDENRGENEAKPKAVVQPSCYMFLDRRDCISYPQKCNSCGNNDLTV